VKYKILIIGGTGVLSTDVVELCLIKRHTVYILNRGRNVQSVPKEVVFLKADIKNSAQVNEILKDLYFDVVVDFISYHITDIKNSLSLFKKKCHQLIFISSAVVYRRAKEDGIITEDSPLVNPNWDYSVNKADCERYLISQCAELRLKYTIVRPYITYGNSRIPYGIMPPYGWHWTLIERILNNKPIFIWDQGKTVVTLTHSSDFAKGLVGLFCNPKAYNESLHIVSDESISWKELLNLIGRLIDKKPLITEIPSAYAAAKLPSFKGMILGDRSLDAVFDNSKIKSAVPEFICTTPMKKGISQSLEYYRDNNFLKGIDYKWDAQMDKLIYEYLKENDPDKLNMYNLKFAKYIEGSFKDKFLYSIYRYFPKVLIRMLELAKKILH